MFKELLISLKYVWLILSFIGFILILIPIIDTDKRIYNLTPICPSKLKNKTCILCGSTTSFYLLGIGEFEKAKNTNWIAFYLYFVIVFNTIFLLVLFFAQNIKFQIKPL